MQYIIFVGEYCFQKYHSILSQYVSGTGSPGELHVDAYKIASWLE